MDREMGVRSHADLTDLGGRQISRCYTMINVVVGCGSSRWVIVQSARGPLATGILT